MGYHQYVLVVIIWMSCLYSAPMGAVVEVDIGVILDLETPVGKMGQTCMLTALEDFYGGSGQNYTTKIVLHYRDSKSEIVEAASAAIDLLKNVHVHAIVGPQRSTQADFVIDIGNRAQILILSPATSPSLSHKETPYFVRSSQSSTSHTKAIAAIVKAIGWRDVTLVYEDTNYGGGIVPYLTDELLEIGTHVKHRSVISPLATDDQIMKELYKLKSMYIRVFVVHMLPPLASRLFLMAEEVGMMSKGYAWIITDALTILLDTMNSTVINSMQGVIGAQPYVPRSNALDNLTKKWKKRNLLENPNMEMVELNVFGLWAYDSIFALATAVQRTDMSLKQFNKPVKRDRNTDLAAIGTSQIGPKLLQSILNIRFKGVSGDFQFVNGELQSSASRIINVNGNGVSGIGFWTEKYGISNELMMPNHNDVYTTKSAVLRSIIWPGKSSVVPKGWELPVNEKKLRVGVPVKNGFKEFARVEKDPQTNAISATGFCIDVFKEVMESLPYVVPYEFIPFKTPDHLSVGIYNDLVYQVFLEKFDAVVGDVTIIANRSKFVDFTLPFTESGVRIIVPITGDERKNAWIFMKPLNMDLWLTTGAFFFITALVIKVLEHTGNIEFRGSRNEQCGKILYFSFSTLVFSHREQLKTNLARFVVIVWVFLVLVLTSSYTANLTSMLTVQQLQPTFTDIKDLIKNGEYVGYQRGSFITGLLEGMNFNSSKLKFYDTVEEYDEALSNGTKEGGVGAIIDELPYIRLFLAKYCSKYTMIGPTYQTAGFGFVFPKGSPLVSDVSSAVLNVTQGEKMSRISKQWFDEGDEINCPEQNGRIITSDSLTLDSFKGLFIITGITFFLALLIFLFFFLHDNWRILVSNESIGQRFVALARAFNPVIVQENPQQG